jgi:hypothetical protein
MSANGHNGKLSPRRLAALTKGCLLIDDARMYGLIDGGPKVDRERCVEVLDRLRKRGVVPTEEEAERAALDLMAELGAVRR